MICAWIGVTGVAGLAGLAVGVPGQLGQLTVKAPGVAQRARLDLAPPPAAFPEEKHGPEEILGLTPREAQVLNLLARGYTNREIAAALVISVKTVSVHVWHILRKLGVPNRLEAAATISRLAPPPSGQSEPKA